MKRTYKALLTLALALSLLLSLGMSTLCAALEPEAADAVSAGYLVQLRALPTEEPSLFSFLDPVDEVPESLVLLSERDAIYKAAQLSDIQDLVYAGRVVLAEPDYQAELFDVTATPNDRYFNESTYQYNLKDGVTGIKVQAAWDAGLSGEGVTVAVLDSGLGTIHPDTPAKIGIGRYYYYREYGLDPNDANHPEDFVFTLNDSNGHPYSNEDGTLKKYAYFSSNDTQDTIGHGTFVTGIIAAKSNNRAGTFSGGIAGIAPDVTILPVRCFTATEGHKAGYASNMISALEYAAQHGADVINMSWGITQQSQLLQAAINTAANAGCILVAAVGNGGSAVLNYPAAYPNVIGVGASQRSVLAPCSFSQRNGSVDIYAPGEYLTSLSRTSATSMAVDGHGTSFSAPQVAAVAALLLQAHPDLTHAQYAALLKDVDCCDAMATVQPYTDAGFLNVQKLLDRLGSTALNLTVSPGSYSLQACFHPSDAQEKTESGLAGSSGACLILLAAYNKAGHLVASSAAAQPTTVSKYGGYQYSWTLTQPDVATVRAFVLANDATLHAYTAPLTRTLGEQ